MSAEEVFLERALVLAHEAVHSGSGGPFGALVVRGSEVLGLGWNRVLETRDPTAHAEIVAIREACRALGTHDLSSCEIYSSCEPCPMCLGAILWARLPRLTYAATRDDAAAAGFDDADFYRELLQPEVSRMLVRRRLALPERRAPFEAWLQKPDRRQY